MIDQDINARSERVSGRAQRTEFNSTTSPIVALVDTKGAARVPTTTGTGEVAARAPQSTAAENWPLGEHYSYVSIDRAFKASLARLTLGLSPAVLAEQTLDWLGLICIKSKRGQRCDSVPMANAMHETPAAGRWYHRKLAD